MGNCVSSSSRVDSSHITQNAAVPLKANGKTGLPSPSARTKSSTPSSLSVPSYAGKSTDGPLPTPRTEGEILSSTHLKAFTFNELRNATRNFRSDSLLGEGGFGFVYKGWIDEHTLSATRPGSGIIVAIKRLKPEGFQGHKEWVTEVQYLGQLHHPNLVKLIGYCSEGDNRLLVYEFMPKGSLENHLFRSMRSRTTVFIKKHMLPCIFCIALPLAFIPVGTLGIEFMRNLRKRGFFYGV